MIDVGLIEKLARSRGAPAVSILFSLDAARPGNAIDATLVEHLRHRAVDRVRADARNRNARALVGRVNDAFAELDLSHPPVGVAIYASAEEHHIIELPVRVAERVSISDAFAIRALIDALEAARPVRVVVLSQRQARCFEASGGALREVRGAGFPVEFERMTWTETAHKDLPPGERVEDETLRNELRAVDAALTAVQARGGLPVVVVGTERDVSFFRKLSSAASDIIGEVHGNYDFADAHGLGRLVAPVIDEHRRAQQRAACERVADASNRVAIGIDAVWAAARAGRGHELVLEAGFRYPAFRSGDLLEPAAPDEATYDDAVEAVVRDVVGSGGTVTVVPDGALADHGHIALLLRY